MNRRTIGCNGGRESIYFEAESRSRGPAEPGRYFAKVRAPRSRKSQPEILMLF